MREELLVCRRRGCEEEPVWEESFAGAATPGLCERHAAEARAAADGD